MAKCSMECKLKIVREYLAGKGSYEALSKQHKIASGHIKTWVKVEERIFRPKLQYQIGQSSITESKIMGEDFLARHRSALVAFHNLEFCVAAY